MIFVTVGTHQMPFNRLLVAVDAAGEGGLLGDAEIVVQSGSCTHRCAGTRQMAYVSGEEFDSLLDRADLVISHGGIGTVLTALRRRKHVIAIPRLQQFGEHNNDHQLQVCAELDRQHALFTSPDTADLPALLARDIAELSPFDPPTDIVDAVRADLASFARRRSR